MNIVNSFKFISWDEFGEEVAKNVDVEPSISMGQYARIKGYDVKNRLPSAVKELLTLAKLYDIKYNNFVSPVLFPWGVLEAIFNTVIVSAAERDLIIRAQSGIASEEVVLEAEELISQLLPSPKK